MSYIDVKRQQTPCNIQYVPLCTASPPTSYVAFKVPLAWLHGNMPLKAESSAEKLCLWLLTLVIAGARGNGPAAGMLSVLAVM